MSAAEIIEQIKKLPQGDREAVRQYLNGETASLSSLYDEFTRLGNEQDGADVSFAYPAQREVIKNGHS